MVLEKRNLPAIFKDVNSLVTLEQLCKSSTYVRDVGRQLGQSQCTGKFLDIIFEKSSGVVERWQQLILRLTQYSCDLREVFGQKSIKEIVLKQKISRCITLFLCYFALDAWARKHLRLENALQVVLERYVLTGCCSSSFNIFRLSETSSLEEQSQIVAALKFFIYDSEGLTIICHRNEITSICIQSMNHFLENADRKHFAGNQDVQAEEDQMESAARGEATPIRSEFIEKVTYVNQHFKQLSFLETHQPPIRQVFHSFAFKLPFSKSDF